jgi:bifunctional DNA-binding transcriptional regulator/antitoxin component of YhaV-PrlF toxin-antitoxin module
MTARTIDSREPSTPTGETTITGKNQVSLPARGVRQLGWERGDRLLVHVLGHDLLLLTRKPEDPAAYFAGKLGHVFGTHAETLRFLEEERGSWAAKAPRHRSSTPAKREPGPRTAPSTSPRPSRARKTA